MAHATTTQKSDSSRITTLCWIEWKTNITTFRCFFEFYIIWRWFDEIFMEKGAIFIYEDSRYDFLIEEELNFEIFIYWKWKYNEEKKKCSIELIITKSMEYFWSFDHNRSMERDDLTLPLIGPMLLYPIFLEGALSPQCRTRLPLPEFVYEWY